ncbi:MAG: class I SAM-dependent methyltransferase [Planctomycetota bacterium]
MPERLQRDELLEVNRRAWNAQVARKNRWTEPVSREQIEQARNGNVEIVLTPRKMVPRDWFPDFAGCNVLLLAGGGGQQAPILAAAGATVTVVDLSDSQLEQDQVVARREGLTIRSIRASMDRLVDLKEGEFDFIVHPCSNCFVPDLKPVWAEAARVLRQGGTMISGFCNPLIFLFDEEVAAEGRLEVQYCLPYSDEEQLGADRLAKLRADDEPVMFGHTLNDQIGEQLRAGFALTDMYEDKWGGGGDPGAADQDSSVGSASDPTGIERLDRHISSFIATRCQRV